MRHSVSMLALVAGMMAATLGGDADASTEKAAKKAYKFSGGIQLGVSTDRNAGAAPTGDGMKGDSFDDDDEDEDEDEDDSNSDFDGDTIEDLDLDDQDVLDQLDETSDEDGDGDFFDDDEDFEEGDPVAADLDGDGIDDDFDGDGTLDDADGDGLDDPGQGDDDLADGGDALPDDGADGDAGGDAGADAGGDAGGDAGADAGGDAGDAGAGDAGGDAGGGEIQLARAGRRNASPDILSDERLTTKAKLGFSHKLSWAKEWKAAAQIGTASFDTLDKSNNMVFAFNTGPTFAVKSLKATIQPSFAFANLRKDGKEQFNNYAGILNTQFALTKEWGLNLRYGYDVREFEDQRIDNITAHSPSAAVAYKIAKNQAVMFGTRFRFEDTEVMARAKDQYQLVLGYKQKWNSGWYVAPQVGYAFIQRGAAVNARQARRQDDRTTFNLAVGRDMGYGINVEAQYGQMESDSNILNKDTSNDRFVLLTGWKF